MALRVAGAQINTTVGDVTGNVSADLLRNVYRQQDRVRITRHVDDEVDVLHREEVGVVTGDRNLQFAGEGNSGCAGVRLASNGSASASSDSRSKQVALCLHEVCSTASNCSASMAKWSCSSTVTPTIRGTFDSASFSIVSVPMLA